MTSDLTRSVPDRDTWLRRNREAWNGRAQGWDAMLRERSGELQQELERSIVALQLAPGLRVLDAGCGSGQWAVGFAAFGCDVTAVDLSPEMLALTREHAASADVSLRVREGDFATNDDPDRTYDAIHCRCALQFHPDPAAALREFRRLLVPGGRLLASVPGALSPIYATSWRRYIERETTNTFMVPWELEALLHELGWVVQGGWGLAGRSGNGTANDVVPQIDGDVRPQLPERLQQAAATYWVTIAAVPLP
jgi:SAM-dependent methyltransferase